ncbi:hypothetical protein MLD38_030379 [Melastoma candidum]|uniref:Uncharacterized protein n=1 Tax=Melastoma candidum TaxID=119954 RepID=A0ACB9MLK6_9MYRT|nr:hypothetical protein MLD38_030379 [Melastoma candidum]
MDSEEANGAGKKMRSPCDVEALKKCLEETKGDYLRCQSHIDAFKSSCSLKKQPSSSSSSAAASLASSLSPAAES